MDKVSKKESKNFQHSLDRPNKSNMSFKQFCNKMKMDYSIGTHILYLAFSHSGLTFDEWNK